MQLSSVHVSIVCQGLFSPGYNNAPVVESTSDLTIESVTKAQIKVHVPLLVLFFFTAYVHFQGAEKGRKTKGKGRLQKIADGRKPTKFRKGRRTGERVGNEVGNEVGNASGNAVGNAVGNGTSSAQKARNDKNNRKR